MKRLSSLPVVLAVLALLLVAAPAATAETAAAPKAPAATAKEAKAADDADGAGAAARRAASSEFEREQLDQDAFKEEDRASSGDDETSKGGGSGSVLRAILGLVVVLGAIFGVHWLLRKWGTSRMQGVAGRSGVIDVVATTTLAQGRALHLVRVGGELVLVGATDQSITRIGDFDATALAADAGNAGRGEFQAALTGAMYGTQPGVPAGMGGAGSTDQPFLRRFVDNLRMSTAR